MGPKTGYWTPFEPNHYLDLRQPQWADAERQRWVRYIPCDLGASAFVYIHALEARWVIEELGRLNAARLPEPPAPGACDSSSQWPPRWRLR